jgi:hypothetical protein
MSNAKKDNIELLLLDFLAAVEGAARAAREALQRALEAEIGWQQIQAPRPLDPQDRAINWLKRRLMEIQSKHPELKTEFVTDGKGYIASLRFQAPDGEVRDDVASVTNWAFEKASMRPQTSEAANPKQVSEG